MSASYPHLRICRLGVVSRRLSFWRAFALELSPTWRRSSCCTRRCFEIERGVARIAVSLESTKLEISHPWIRCCRGRMLLRCLRQLQPVVRRSVPLVRGRHSQVPPEFRAFTRLFDEFVREPFVVMPKIVSRFECQPWKDAPSSGIQFYKEDGKLVAQIRLPREVKPEDVKISMKDGRLCVSVRTEIKEDNFRSVKEFHEEIKLDDTMVHMDKLDAFVDKDEGQLRIEAPLKDEHQSESTVRVKIENASGSGSKTD